MQQLNSTNSDATIEPSTGRCFHDIELQYFMSSIFQAYYVARWKNY